VGEQLFEDELVEALGCFVVLFTVVDFVIAKVLSDEVSESFQRLESHVSRL